MLERRYRKCENDNKAFEVAVADLDHECEGMVTRLDGTYQLTEESVHSLWDWSRRQRFVPVLSPPRSEEGHLGLAVRDELHDPGDVDAPDLLRCGLLGGDVDHPPLGSVGDDVDPGLLNAEHRGIGVKIPDRCQTRRELFRVDAGHPWHASVLLWNWWASRGRVSVLTT